jgi:two-component sensor histidine kinase
MLNSIDELNSFGISIIVSLVEQLGGEVSFSNDNGAKMALTIKSNSTLS